MAERFISLRDVLTRTSLSKTHTYRLINAGTFPRPVPLGPRRVAFIEREVNDWLSGRLAAREADEGAAHRSELARHAQAARD